MNREELVTVASFHSLIEADLARSRLEAEGITVFLAGEQVAQAMPYLFGAAGGIRLLVPKSEAEAALSVLSSNG